MKSPSIASRQRIWEAAYAAAFVRGFEATRQYHLTFEAALEGKEAALEVKAEQAIAVADAAVAQLSKWIDENGPESMGR